MPVYSVKGKFVAKLQGKHIGYARTREIAEEIEKCYIATLPDAENIHQHLRQGKHVYEDFKPQRKGEPVIAIPGSQNKLEILRKRVENGEELFHENDQVPLE